MPEPTPNLVPAGENRIKATHWFTTVDGYLLGAVVVDTATGHWKAYIGVASGSDELLDAYAIAKLGAKMPMAFATAMFPQMDAAWWTD